MKPKPNPFSAYSKRSTISTERALLTPFARRRQISLGNFETWIVSREDLVLSKLVWAKDSRSEIQLRDVRNLLSADCDMDYLRSRAKTLKVDELLEELLVDE